MFKTAFQFALEKGHPFTESFRAHQSIGQRQLISKHASNAAPREYADWLTARLLRLFPPPYSGAIESEECNKQRIKRTAITITQPVETVNHGWLKPSGTTDALSSNDGGTVWKAVAVFVDIVTPPATINGKAR